MQDLIVSLVIGFGAGGLVTWIMLAFVWKWINKPDEQLMAQYYESLHREHTETVLPVAPPVLVDDWIDPDGSGPQRTLTPHEVDPKKYEMTAKADVIKGLPTGVEALRRDHSPVKDAPSGRSSYNAMTDVWQGPLWGLYGATGAGVLFNSDEERSEHCRAMLARQMAGRS